MANDRIAKYEKAVEAIKVDLAQRKAESHGGGEDLYGIGHFEGIKMGLELALEYLEVVEDKINLNELPETIDSEEHEIHRQLMASRNQVNRAGKLLLRVRQNGKITS